VLHLRQPQGLKPAHHSPQLEKQLRGERLDLDSALPVGLSFLPAIRIAGRANTPSANFWAGGINEHRRAFWQVHLCVLLWGFTAILGKLITLPAQALVVWRMALVCVFLALLPKVWRGIAALKPKLILTYAGIGTIVALHWLTFYGAIKLSNASVAVSCLALGTGAPGLCRPLDSFVGSPKTRRPWISPGAFHGFVGLRPARRALASVPLFRDATELPA